ncbi:heparinase II/III domain-containing protein [Vallitalea okinawensis]|uniref:heparinase II/III domain-containing protein n=1 Tax=Vallitalea okinawensis TaxID=2078660 RepID=UPI001300B9C4|nr:heparinase II/III family protein [Vallitalea okinawensis]
MFVDDTTYQQLKGIIQKIDDFRPCPQIDERDKWNEIPEDIKELVIEKAAAYKGYRFPVIHATDLMSFLREGTRKPYGDAASIRKDALAHLIMAECIVNDGSYMDDIINAFWCICEESTWVSNYHYYLFRTPEPTMFPPHDQRAIDLGCSETAVLLAFTYYLLKDKLDEISPILAQRIKHELKDRIIDPFLYNRQWWWMGYSGRKLNNWAPWCSSNCLMTMLLVEEDVELRRLGVFKTIEIIDKFIGIYSEDGGCDEGPAYWNRAAGSLYDCLWIINKVTEGKVNYFDETIIKHVGEFPAKVHIAKNCFTNFADSHPYLKTNFSLLYRFGKDVNSDEMKYLAQTMYKELGLGDPAQLGVLRGLPYLFMIKEFRNLKNIDLNIKLSNVFDGIQVLTTRESQDKQKGFYLAIKGGFNDESHNHNDLGNFIVYYNGRPCIIDIGCGTYVKDTFGPNRYKIWNMQGQYHNVPIIGEIQQCYGARYEAKDFKVKDFEDGTSCHLNLHEAYEEDAGIEKYIRTATLSRETSSVTIMDTLSLNVAKEITFNFMLCKEPCIRDNTVVLRTTEEDEISLEFDNLQLEASYETIEIKDETLLQVWGERLYRLQIKTKNSITEGEFSFNMQVRE